MSEFPSLSIIVPCFNEQATIRLLLEAILRQTYPLEHLEVVIADGQSTDNTRQEIAAFQLAHPELQVMLVDNPQRNIPSGLNRAIAASTGAIILRLDAHSMPEREYIEHSVADLQAGLGDNVGGVWVIQPGKNSWVARSIAAAAGHPFGVGDAQYRYTERAGAVDTVPFGAYYRTLFERLAPPPAPSTAPYDESLLTNEDYEFNTRIRQAGGMVWLDPKIRSAYFARPNFPALARQYARYGFWKQRMLRRYPGTLRWRQALPPLFVLSLPTLAIGGLLWPPLGWLLILELSLYLLALGFAGVQLAAQRRDAALLMGVPLAIATMHLAWGSAFLWSLLRR